MQARLYDRLSAFLSVVFLLVLGAGTYYLAAWATRDGSPAIQTRTNDPNIFVEGVSLTRTNESGIPVFEMSADSMRHYPIDGSSKFERPRLVSVDPQRPVLTLTADQAITSVEGKETVLSGHVVLTRPAIGDKPALIIRTDQLTLIGDSEIARTTAPVSIVEGDARLTATGMEFDNLTRDIRLFSQVRGVWPPPETNKSGGQSSPTQARQAR
ncbi:MAG: LPS export ABC transporter periplasmic protein LptC [Burkholderiaceae bacterium]